VTTEKESPDETDWSGAVDDVLEKVARHQAAVLEAEKRQRPPGQGRVLVSALVALAAVVAWNAWMLTRIPEGLPPEVVAEDLRYTVHFAAGAIEDFRAEHGRLPTAAEVEEYLGPEMVYEVDGNAFTVTATDAETQVTYDGSVPLTEWIQGSGGGS
jgi:hypothetical protein